MEKQFTPNIEQPKPFEQKAAEAVHEQELALDAIRDKNRVQEVAAETIRIGSREVIEKSE